MPNWKKTILGSPRWLGLELTDPARRKPRHFHSRPAEARTVNESAVTHSFILRVLAPPQKTRSAPLILRLAAGM